MTDHVTLQVILAHKAFVAHVTREGFFPGVNAQVRVKIRQPVKLARTQRTFVRSFVQSLRQCWLIMRVLT